MKPIIKKEVEDTILTSEITENHIVVSVIKNRPAIVSEIEGKNDFRMLAVDKITKGAFFGTNTSSLTLITERYIDNDECTIEVFNKCDWKKALQWLIDNCE